MQQAQRQKNSYTPPISAQHIYEHAYGDERFYWTNKIAGIPLQINSAQKKNTHAQHVPTAFDSQMREYRATRRESTIATISMYSWNWVRRVRACMHIWYFYTFIHVIISDILSWLASSQLPISFGRIRPHATASTAAFIQSHTTPTDDACLEWQTNHISNAMHLHIYGDRSIHVRVF